MRKMFKRLLSFAMAALMVLSLVPFNGLEVYAVQTAEADLEISTVDQLQAFAAEVNAGNSYEGKLVVLTDDIDLGYTAVVIGKKGSPFKGTFDGQDHTVSNLTIYEDGSESDYFADTDDCLGLFGVINTPAVVKNVTVDDPYIVGSSYVGGIVGMAYTGRVENCHVTGEIDIEGFYMVGGITGHGYAKIYDCSVIGEEGWAYNYVGASYQEANLEGDNVGGIVGHAAENNNIEGCTVKNVTVSGTRKVGGIVGITAQSSDIISCTVADVTVETTATEEYAADNAKTMSIGGVVGQYMENDKGVGGTLTGCAVSGLTFTNEYDVTVSAGALTGGVRGTSADGKTVAPAEGSITVSGNTASAVEGETVTYLEPAAPSYAAMIGEQGYATFAEALAAAKTLTGDVTVAIYDKVTLNASLSGSYDSITFVGRDTDAEVYLDVQGYITATGKKVTFEDLTLSKAEGKFITNAGFMNVAFGVYDVSEVTYNDCTFANGAYAASGEVTYNRCTFKRSWDKYGLWAYGDVDVTVDGCTFADYRGIKMYAEGAAKTVDLTVKNTDFSAVNDKPAIVLTYGESVTLEKNTYSSTGAFELDLDGAPNGTAVTTDTYKITCKNDNGACGVLVDGKIYTTVAQAAAVATEGSTVTLLHNSAETVELAEGVTLNKNDYTADGVSVAAPVAQTMDAEGNVVGAYFSFEEALAAACADANVTRLEILADCQQTAVANTEDYNYVKKALTIGAPAGESYTVTVKPSGDSIAICVQAGGSLTIEENVTIDHLDVVANGFYTNGENMTIGGTLYAKSLKQWTSNGTITVTETGKVILGNGDGQLDLNYGSGDIVVNGTLINTADLTGVEPQVKAGYTTTQGYANGNKLDLNNTYLEAGAWFTMGGKNAVISIDNSLLKISGGDSVGYMTVSGSGNSIELTDGGLLQMGGALTLGAGNQLKLDATSKVTAKTLAGAGIIVIDGTGMVAGQTYENITADLSGYTGEIQVENNTLNAEIVDGKIVLKAAPAIMVTYPVGNPVYPEGKIEYYNDMLEAVPYTTNCPRLEGATVTLLKDIEAPGIRLMENDLVLDLNGHTYTITAGTGSQGTNTSGFQIRPEVTTVATIKNGTIQVAEGAPVVWMFNNYATDFVIEDVTVDCANMAYSYGQSCYVHVSRAGDNTQFTGTTKIINFNVSVAGDAINVGGAMTVGEGVQIGGSFELDAGASLTAPAGLEVTAPEGYKVVYENGVYTAVEIAYVAQVGDDYYSDLQSALDAAVAGTGNVTVEILRDVDLTNVDWKPVVVSGPGYPLVTVNGNGKIITGLNDMLFASTWAGKSGLIINDLTIKNSNIANDVEDSKGTVGVGAFIGYPQASATITLNNCHLVDSTVSGGHWTGGLIGMAGGYNGNDGPVFMNLTITGCSVTGSTITGKGSVGGVIGHGSCAAWTNVVIENTVVSGNTITSTGSSTVKAGSVMGTIGAAGQPTTAAGETKTGGASVSATTSGNTVTSGGTTITTIYGRQGTPTGLLTVTGGAYEKYPIEENVSYAAPEAGYKIVENENGTYGLAECEYVAETNGTKYETLQAAIDAAGEGDTVTLLTDIELTQGVTVAADKQIILDLNGKTVSMETADDAKYYLIYNKGDLTITDSGENGKLSYHYTGTNSGDAYNTVESAPGSVLTVQDGTIENLSANCLIAYAIDGLTNGSAGDVTVNIEGGKITSKKIAVRIFANSTSKTGTLNISGGEISGRVIIQNANANANKAVLSITSGTFNSNGYKADVLYVGGSNGATTDIAANVSGGTFNGEILSSINKGFITGGTFNTPVAEELCAEGYGPADNGDGTYGVKVGLPEVAITDIKKNLTGEDPDLTFALNFAISNVEDLTEEYLNELFEVYGDYYVDYVLTINGLNGDTVTFNANGNADGYLAGQYDAWSKNWVTVPFEDVVVEDGKGLYIMEYAAKLMGKQGLRFTLAEVAAIVQNFDCGVYFTPEFLAEHPDLDVSLQLKVFTEDAQGNKIENIDVATNEFENSYYAAISGEGKQTVYYATFADAYAAAQAGDTVELLKDLKLPGKLTVAKAITIDGNGCSIIADETATWYTTGSKPLYLKQYKTHLIGINSDNVTLKDVILDCNDNAAGINAYCAQNVVFDNVQIINATKGMAGLTVNGSTLTAKNALTISGNAIAIDISNGSGVTSDLGMTIEAGTVTDLGNKTVKFASVANNNMTGAVDANGNAYFVAMDNAYYYTQAQIDSRTTGYSNGLTLLDDVTLSKDVTIGGTLDLNGHDLTVADSKALKVSKNLTITGEGNFSGNIQLTKEAATVTAPSGMDVEPLEGYQVVYEGGVYSLAKQVVQNATTGKMYTSLKAAVEAAVAGDTLTLLADIALTDTLIIDKVGAITIDGNGKSITLADSFENKNTWGAAIMIGNSNNGDAETANRAVTIKNVTFDKITGNSIIRVQGVTLNMDGCAVKDCDSTNTEQGMLRIDNTVATITNTEFTGNKATKIIGHNHNSSGSASKAVINGCAFTDNTITGPGVIVLSSDAGCTIANSSFVGNDITCTNGATVYMGFSENNVVTGNLFKDNVVTGNATSNRIAGALFVGYTNEITGNAFVNNTATNASGTAANDVCVDTIYALPAYGHDLDIDLSGNYFDGVEPVEGDHYTVNSKVEDAYSVNSYYTAYTENADGAGVTLTGEVKIGYVAQIGETKYETLEAALSEATAGQTVQLIADCSAEEVYVRRGRTLDLNGYTLTVADGGDVTAANATAQIIDSTNGKGVLNSARDASFNANNKYLPVWVEGEGFHFVIRDFITRVRTHETHASSVAEGQVVFRFQLKGTAADCVLAQQLANGGADNGVSMKIKMVWTNAEGKTFEQYFTCTDAQVKAYATAANAQQNWEVGYIELTLNGVQNISELSFTAMLTYGTSVQLASDAHEMN